MSTRDFRTETFNAINNELYAIMDANLGLQGYTANRAELEALIPGAGPHVDAIIEHYTQLHACVQEIGIAVDEVFSAASKADEEFSRQLRGAKEKADAMYRFLKVQTEFINPVGSFGAAPPLLMNPDSFRNLATELGQNLFMNRAMNALMSVLLAEVNGELILNEDKLETLLRRPYNEFSYIENAVLAAVLLSDLTIEQREMFFNLLADPIAPTDSNNVSIFNFTGTLMEDIRLFEICPNKVGGIQQHIDNAILAVLDQQMQLGGRGAPGYNDLDAIRRNMIQQSAFLTGISGLTPSMEGALPMRQLLYIQGSDAIGPFALVRGDDNPNHAMLSFNSGGFSYLERTISNGNTSQEFVLNDPRPSTLYFSMVRQGSGVNSQIEGLSETEFILRHRSDPLSQIILGTGGVAAGAAMSNPLAAAGVGAATLLIDVSSSMGRSNQFQEDIRTLVGNSQVGSFHVDLNLTAVIISDGMGTLQVQSWPSSHTSAGLDALNEVAGTSIEIEDFVRQGQGDAIDAYRGLSDGDRENLGSLSERLRVPLYYGGEQ